MKKLLSLLVSFFLFFPAILLAEDTNGSIGKIIVLAESGYEGCLVDVSDRGERDRIMIKLSNLDLPKGTKLLLYSGMRDAKTPIKIVYTSDHGEVEFEIPNYAKNGSVPIVEHIKFKLADGSNLNFDHDNQWVYFVVNPDGSIIPAIGILMFPGFPTIPLSCVESEEGVLTPGEHPELK